MESTGCRGWYGPDGKFVPCGSGDDHNHPAEVISRVRYGGQSRVFNGAHLYSPILLERGWLRIVSSRVFSAERLNGITAMKIVGLVDDGYDDTFIVELPGLTGSCTGSEVIAHLEGLGLV